MGGLFPANDKRRATRGFTLLELLVTIGIIVILVGILLPALSGMRRAAKNTSTRQLMQSIESAIAQYQTDQRGELPGPWTEEDRYVSPTDTNWNKINNGTGGFSTAFSAKVAVASGYDTKPNIAPTRSEELLMCLMGGMVVNRKTVPPFVADSVLYLSDELDRGHMNMGLKNRSRMPAYMTGSRNRSDNKAIESQFGADDTAIPEFVDDYGMPIVYVRAYKGQNTTTAYYTYQLTNPRPAVIDLDKGQLGLEVARYYKGLAAAKENVLIPPAYVESDNVTTVADPKPTKNQDRFILISAGADKKFGTADDVTNFGAPKLK